MNLGRETITMEPLSKKLAFHALLSLVVSKTLLTREIKWN